MKTIPIAALLVAASLILPVAHAEPSDADTKKLAALRTQAEKGDALAQSALGEAFHLGLLGLTTNSVEAVKWFRQAAGQNFAQAQHTLAYCYSTGQGVALNEVEAVKWWRKAAEQNHAKAQFNLGTSYDKGRGVAQDEVEAVRWWRKAAEQNFAAAQSNLGVRYERGEGVVKDEVEAYKWALLAAAQGDTKAKRNVTLLELMLSPEQIAAGKQRVDDWLTQRKNPATSSR